MNIHSHNNLEIYNRITDRHTYVHVRVYTHT